MAEHKELHQNKQPGRQQNGKARKPLSEQIAECQQSWFVEAKQYAAEDEDFVQMGLVGLMLQQGWGCKKDPQEAAKWLAEAARRGAEMPPGYKIPHPPPPPPAELAHLPPPGTRHVVPRSSESDTTE